jgi:hypothetical protein
MKTTHKEILTDQVFRLFTDVCGGDPTEFADLLYVRYDVEPGIAFADDAVYFTVLNYFRNVVVPHKIAVWLAGQALLANPDVAAWMGETAAAALARNLWEHDMSKFSAAENVGYALHNFASKGKDMHFERAWHHHKMHNPHHPEYWLNPNRSATLEPMDMPCEYVAEMIADWQGASATYGTDLHAWLRDNLQRFAFSARTAARLCHALRFVGVETDFIVTGGLTGLTLIGPTQR